MVRLLSRVKRMVFCFSIVMAYFVSLMADFSLFFSGAIKKLKKILFDFI